MRPPVGISILFTFIEWTLTENVTVTACFGVDECSYCSLNCSQGHTIRIMEAEYRHMNHSGCLQSKCNKPCCPFRPDDCKENYSEFHAIALYQKCSGKGNCVQYQAPQSSQRICTPYIATYIHLIYQCIAESTFIDICNSPARAFSEVNIMFNNTRSTYNNAVSRCKCNLVSNTRINYQIVDIRFFTSSTTIERDYNCTSGKISIFGNVTECTQNVTKGFVYMRSQTYTGNLTQGDDIIELTYYESNKPEMVWIHLSGSNDTFMITCTIYSSMTEPIVTTTPSSKDTTTPKSNISNGHSTTKIPTLSKTSFTHLPSAVSPSKASINSSNISTRPDLTTLSSRDTADFNTSFNEDNRKPLTIIVGVVVSTVILIAIVTIVIILLRRRKANLKKDADNSRYELPSGSINSSYQSVGDSEINNADNETNNYDSINDESIVTYSKPIKKMKDIGIVPNGKTSESRDVSSDEYDRIEFEKKWTRKVIDYDSFPAVEEKTDGNSYSHVSIQCKADPSSNVNEYSHCKVINEDSPIDDQSYTNTPKNEYLRNDDYGHVDLDEELKTGRPSSKNEDDSYNCINLDNTANPNRNGQIESGENLCRSKDSSTLTNIKREIIPINDEDADVTSMDPRCPGINDAPMRDHAVEFKHGDIYDTPSSKDQQYTVIFDDKSDQQYNKANGDSKGKSVLEQNQSFIKNSTSTCDYELAKPTFT